jgi:HD-GYP domain-containing protein (c-di-GMP phosphodiesterase class II)
MAKKEYRDAYESGDGDKLVEAQEKMTSAKIKLDRVFDATQNLNQRRALQEQENDVQIQQQPVQQPMRDSKAQSWQEKNSWFGQDDEMTSLALGLHEKLVKQNGMAYATTDEYYKRIDETMRKRFPENFEDVDDEKPQSKVKPSTVVASASRSTSSKKVRLTTSQQAIAKKLGLTNEQYARELIKEI